LFQKILKSKPQRFVDLVIATPGVCSKLITNGEMPKFFFFLIKIMICFDADLIQPGLLQTLVLDEADTLLDDSFGELVLRVIKRLRISSEKPLGHSDALLAGTQVALVSATMPRDLQRILSDIVPVC
jgi:superfamily II DNA/RNA helicase